MDGTICPCCRAKLPDTGVSFDLPTGDLIVKGERKHIPPQPAAVLGMLAKYPGRMLTREQLLDSFCWRRSSEEQPSLDLINVYMSQLRKVLKGSPVLIETCWNGAFRMTGGAITLIDTSVDDDEIWDDLGISNPDDADYAAG